MHVKMFPRISCGAVCRCSIPTTNTREGKVFVQQTLFAQDILGQRVSRTHVELGIKFALPHRRTPRDSPTVELRDGVHNLLGGCFVPSMIALRPTRGLRGNCARSSRGSAACRRCRNIRRGRHGPVENWCRLPPGVHLHQRHPFIVRSSPGSTYHRKRKC